MGGGAPYRRSTSADAAADQIAAECTVWIGNRPHHLSLEVAVQALSEASEVDPSPGPTRGSESDSDSRGVNDANGPFTDTEAAPGRGG